MSKKIKFVDGNMVDYEILNLVDSYDPILRERCKEVDFEKMPGNYVAQLALSLMESLNEHQGLGLSANQVGIGARMCAINMLEEKKIYCLINPRIVSIAETTSKYKEGCLSFPGLFLEIERPSWVEIEFQAANGEKMTKRFEGIYATCVLHELDHLDGIVFTTRVSSIKLDMARRKIKQNLRKIKRITRGAA
jgi:peptide deformylase